MNPIPELSPLLKQLRLSGILDSLEARNREAIDRKLSYIDFLSLLTHDEVARRDQKKLALRLRRANFRNQKTLEGFNFDLLPNLNRAAVHDLANVPLRRGEGRGTDFRENRHREKPSCAGFGACCGPPRTRSAVPHANRVVDQPAVCPRDRHVRAALPVSGKSRATDNRRFRAQADPDSRR